MLNIDKKICDKPLINYERTNEVRELGINILTHDYEHFNMKANEFFTKMFIQFTNVVNDLQCLRKLFLNYDLVTKELRKLQ